MDAVETSLWTATFTGQSQVSVRIVLRRIALILVVMMLFSLMAMTLAQAQEADNSAVSMDAENTIRQTNDGAQTDTELTCPPTVARLLCPNMG